MRLTIFALFLALANCATAGTGQEPVGEGQWEVRVWDGSLCNKGRDLQAAEADCKKALEPKFYSHARVVCNGDPKEISDCRLTSAPSGPRLKCKVSCK